MNKKCCTQCKAYKKITEYHKNKNSKDGLQYQCKACCSKNEKEYRKKNIQKARSFSNNWYKNNKEKHSASSRKRYRKHKDSILKNNLKRQKQRIKMDENYRIIRNYRTRIWSFMKGRAKEDKHSIDLLGCSIESFWLYLEGKFQQGMTRKNYGKWHIDHIIPLSSASNQEELEKLFHYTNCQPLWAKDNLAKNNRLDWSKDIPVH